MSSSSGYRAALRVGDFRALFLARLISVLGDSAAYLAVTVLVFARTGSSLLASLTFAISFLPYLLGGSLLSASVDRFPTRALLIGTDLGAAALVLVIALPGTAIPVVFGCLFLIGTLAPIRGACLDTLTAELLPGELYVAGRSLQQLSSQLAQLTGIAAAGLVLAPLGVRGALLLDLGTFLVSAAFIRLGTAARPVRVVERRHNLAADSLLGLRRVWSVPTVSRLLLLGWLVPFVSVWPEAVAAPAVAQAGYSAGLVGLWLAAIPVGMVAGNLAVVLLPTGRWRGPAMVPMALAGMSMLLAFGLRPQFPVRIGLLVAVGLFASFELELDRRLRDAVPSELRSRAFALRGTGLMVGQGLGFVAAGVVAERWSAVATTTAAGAIGCAVVLVVGWRLRPGGARERRPPGGRPSHRGLEPVETGDAPTG